jgi:hypothetical protein
VAATFGEPFFVICLFGILGYSLFNKERTMAILFLSGLLKIAPSVSTLPNDITFSSLVIYLLYRVKEILTIQAMNKKLIQIMFLLVIAWLVVMGSFIYTKATWLYLSKSSVNIVFLYIPLALLIINDLGSNNLIESKLSSFVRPILLFSALWTGVGFHNDLNDIVLKQIENTDATVAHISAFGENYMYFSSFVCFIIIYYFVEFYKFQKISIGGIFFILLQCYLLVNSPARGLTIGLLISILLLSLPNISKIKVKYLISLFIAAGVVALSGLYYLNYELSKEQIESLTRLTDFSSEGKSVSHRITSVTTGFYKWNDTLFSILFGLGADSVAFINGDPGLYAHNIILESVLEYGLLGSIPILMFFFVAFFVSKRLLRLGLDIKSSAILWIVGVYYMIFVFSLFSGTLGNSRLLWILTSMIYLLSSNVSSFREELRNNELKIEKKTTPF